MAAILPNVQAAATLSVVVSPIGSKSSYQSAQTVVCASSQLCLQGLSGSVSKGSNRVKVGRGYLDTRKRFKAGWRSRAIASSELQTDASDFVDSSAEMFSSSDTSVPAELSTSDPAGISTAVSQFKDAIDTSTTVSGGEPAEIVSPSILDGPQGAPETTVDALKSIAQDGSGLQALDAVKSAAEDGSAGQALDAVMSAAEDGSAGQVLDTVKAGAANGSPGILSAKEKYLRSIGGGGSDLPKGDDVDLFGGFKNAQDGATDSIKNFFKGFTNTGDSGGSSDVVKSATENESAGDAILSAKERFLRSFGGGGDQPRTEGADIDALGGLKDAQNASTESVNKFFKGFTDAADSVNNSVTDNVVKSATEDGSAGEAILSSKERYLQSIAGGLQQNEDALDGSKGADVDVLGGLKDAQNAATESVNKLFEGFTNTADSVKKSVTDNAIKSATEDGSAGEAILSAKERYLRSIGGGLQQNEDAFDGLKGADLDVFGGLKDAQDAVTDSANSFFKSITDVIDSAVSSVKNTYDTFNSSLVNLVRSATGTVDKTVGGLRPKVDGISSPRVSTEIDFSAPFRMGTPSNDALKEVVIVVKDVTGTVLVTAGDLIAKFYSSAKASLPEDIVNSLDDLEGKVSQVGEPLGSAFNQVYAVVIDAEKAAGINPDNPAIPVVLVLGSTVFFSVSYFQGRYGGYSGDLLPAQALDLLKDERNVVLVDVRPQEIKDVDGIPDLRRSTRSKYASIEVVKADKSLRGQVKNAGELESILTSAVIRNLKNVDNGTKIIVLDGDGSQSKQLARGLKRRGSKRAYRIEGGYKAWAEEGLRSKMDTPQSPLTILKEETEAIIEEVKPTVAGVVGAAVGLVAAAYAILEWEKTLQLIGVIGLAATIYIRVESYESVEDAKADIQVIQKPFKSLLQAILSVAGQADKGELQLATSPASSAVQGRMLQAAAKHGPLASEMEEEEGTRAVEAEESPVDDSDQTHSTTIQEPPQINAE